MPDGNMRFIADKPEEECGIFGIYNRGEDVAELIYLGLFSLQHRGQESAGIAVSDGRQIRMHKGMGLVSTVFPPEQLKDLPGSIGIGHVRYSTTGSNYIDNAQPISVKQLRRSIALAHNGNLINANQLRWNLEEQGAIFQSTSDSEVIMHLLTNSREETIEGALTECMSILRGAYSLVLITERKLIGIRDPLGIRPLCLGKKGESYILASETCSLDIMDAQFVREVEPGEMVIIDEGGLHSIREGILLSTPLSIPNPDRRKQAFCIFEFVYFSRPDSSLMGRSVHLIREEFGRQLAREHPVEADIVFPVPDSGMSAAMGYSRESGIPLEVGLIRNHYIGRTFIQPQQVVRDLGVRIKLNPVKDIIAGKRVVVVDDSIVRGTTSRKIIKMIRQAGAKEIHFRISSPPNKFPCFYGIDTPSRKELIASTHTVEEIRKYIRVDTLGYLSLEGMIKATGYPAERFCLACFDGRYPIEFPRSDINKYIFEGGEENCPPREQSKEHVKKG